MIGDIEDYCIICGIHKDPEGKCPNCRTVYATMEEIEHDYQEQKDFMTWAEACNRAAELQYRREQE